MTERPTFATPIPDDHHDKYVEACIDPSSRDTLKHLRNWGETLSGKNFRAKIHAAKKGDIAISMEQDSVLGISEKRIVHVPSGRILLRVGEVEKVIKSAAEILGPEATVEEILKKTEERYCGVTEKQVSGFLKSWRRPEGNNDRTEEESDTEEPSGSGAGNELKRTGYGIRVIDDDIYDLIARNLVGIDKFSKHRHHGETENTYSRAGEWSFKHSKAVRVEWLKEEDTGKEGWRIFEKNSGRKVPRTSEVPEIIEKYIPQATANLPEKNVRTQEIICRAIAKDWSGISAKKIMIYRNQKDKHMHPSGKDTTVRFPTRPLLNTTHPMQHLQIDVAKLNISDYGGMRYEYLLMVHCCFSHFAFARALPSKDTGLITRHLLDIFGIFGPPEAYQVYTGNETVDKALAEVSKVFGIQIPNMGRKGITERGVYAHYEFRDLLYARARHLFGDPSRWVEAMPFILIEENQRPSALLSSKFTPFEVMFARQPWPGSVKPPWVQGQRVVGRHTVVNEEVAACAALTDYFGESFDLESRQEDQFIDTGLCEEDTYWKRALCQVQMEQYAQRQREVRKSVHSLTQWVPGSFIPPTGVLYCPGDEVYIRHPEWNERSDRQRRTLRRYFKGIVVDRDLRRPLPYLVRWNETEEESAQQRMGEYEGWEHEGWVSIYDVVAVCFEVENRRKLEKGAGSVLRKPAQLCQCLDETCRGFSGKKCAHSMQKSCCLREKGGCEIHKPLKKLRRKRQSSRPESEDEQAEFDQEEEEVIPVERKRSRMNWKAQDERLKKMYRDQKEFEERQVQLISARPVTAPVRVSVPSTAEQRATDVCHSEPSKRVTIVSVRKGSGPGTSSDIHQTEHGYMKKNVVMVSPKIAEALENVKKKYLEKVKLTEQSTVLPSESPQEERSSVQEENLEQEPHFIQHVTI